MAQTLACGHKVSRKQNLSALFSCRYVPEIHFVAGTLYAAKETNKQTKQANNKASKQRNKVNKETSKHMSKRGSKQANKQSKQTISMIKMETRKA